MAKKDNEEIPFSASPSAGNSEKLKALQALSLIHISEPTRP